MKMKQARKRWGLAGLIILAATITLVAWTGNPQQPQPDKHTYQDTVPTKKRAKTTREAGDRDFDRELRALESAREGLSEKDWQKIEEEVNNAIRNFDLDKIEEQVQKAMEQVNLAQIQQQVQESIAKVDFEKIRKEIEISTAHLSNAKKEEIHAEMKKAQEEVEKALADINWKEELRDLEEVKTKEIAREIEKAKAELEKVKVDLKSEKRNFKKELEEAGKEIDKAREELKGYQEMVYAMEQDGLLNTKQDYTIEYRNNELTINGKKQGEDIARKYSQYFKRNDITIRKRNGEIDINNGNTNINFD